ncbi:hypothetical protein AB0C34_17380 [Nocardia sp. NPDC049220]|uniref:hypothetical protein n=1 Tax=Nocardia sp. NPDC049220 TaxID=3155273 RepID=UPI0033E0021C
MADTLTVSRRLALHAKLQRRSLALIIAVLRVDGIRVSEVFGEMVDLHRQLGHR